MASKASRKQSPDWIDVTRTLSQGTIRWPTDPPFHWERIEDISGPGTCNLSRISTGVHMGTHIDAPLHFIEGGADITEVPLSVLCGPAIVIDVQAERDIAIEDIENAGIQPGSALFGPLAAILAFRADDHDEREREERDQRRRGHVAGRSRRKTRRN